VEFINEGKNKVNEIIQFTGKFSGIEVEIAMQYITASTEIIVSFANGIKTHEGGSHETAFKTTITEMINNTARK
jgi:DNA gyrase/topoisomerase IV subunit B